MKGLELLVKPEPLKKVVNGRYTNNYRGSFVGFFPSNDPKYVCLILLDEPKPVGYGGYTAGPIFRQVATRIAGLDSDLQRQFDSNLDDPEIFAYTPFLEGLSQKEAEDILTSLNMDFKISGKSGFILDQQPAAGTTLNAGDKIFLTLSETYTPIDSASTKEGFASIPEMRGMSMRTASNLLSSIGLKSTMVGSGTVFAQFPKAGEWMREGSEVTIRGKAKSLEIITEAGRER
ncbi:MAG: hypothetical protein BalsKO_23620 [Balneolaceae bacterium]